MKTKYIIIIFIIVIMCLSSSSIAGYYYKKKINTDKEIYNKNIDDYNEKYNMNYNNGKLYYKGDFKDMYETGATIISDPEIKDIIVNNKKIRLYNYKINYKSINYVGEKSQFIVPFSFGDIHKFYTTKDFYVPFPNRINVLTNIITTSPLEQDKITVYYNYGSIGRFAPPFLEEKYVTYLKKKIINTK
jgi:hypothetical protein